VILPSTLLVVLLQSPTPPARPWWLEPVGDPVVPAGAAHPIDAFILEKLREAGLRPSPPADRVTLIRRLFLDLHGLPPSPEDVDAFVADARPDAWERLVDRALASPRAGERWAQHWLDIVQYADTHGFETNTPRPNAYRYRDYVVAALNEDKPYDRFVFEQIAGDAVGADAATGFLVAGPWDSVKSPDPGLTLTQRHDELAAMIHKTGTALLALTLGCARCHDHKFDPISQKDFYALEAVFAGVQHGERPIRTPEAADRARALEDATRRVEALRRELAPLERTDFRPRSLLLDDERARVLAPPRGHGDNPPGSARGYRDEAGNAGGGRYRWWDNEPGRDLIAFLPGVSGRRRVWISWGCGWATHTTDAGFVLDRDGDPATREDQTTIAVVDQQRFADGSGDIVSRPLWSGLKDAGVHELEPAAAILVRGGTTGIAVTADAVVLTAPEETTPRLRPPVNAARNVERFAPRRVRFVRFTIGATNNGTEPCIDELEVWSGTTNVARGAGPSSSGNYPDNTKHRLEHINDGRNGNSFSWISNEPGRGWVQLELAEPAAIDRIVWGRDLTGEYTDRLPVAYEIAGAMEPERWELLAASSDRLPPGARAVLYDAGDERVAELEKLEARRRALAAEAAPVAYAGTFQKPGPTHRLYRGDPLQPRETVAPDAPAALGSLNLAPDAPEQQRRVALAWWITDPKHPLTARVMVNRLWQHHFGTGLVETPSDFGANGARPTHPELLDWLAARFVEGGWSLKRLHRTILTSETYRRSAAPDPAALARDAGSRLLWRFPPRRLEAEAIRDSILAVSGALDLSMGGPGFSVFKPNDNYVRVYEPKDEWGPAEWRRMIYMYKVRREQDPVFGAFDVPDAGQVCPKRGRSTTAIQALNLFNSPFVWQQAERMAARLGRETPDDPIRRAFRLALSRDPAAVESAAAAAVVREHGLATFCRALLNTNEFLFLP
jgi:hypothetical protein